MTHSTLVRKVKKLNRFISYNPTKRDRFCNKCGKMFYVTEEIPNHDCSIKIPGARIVFDGNER